MFPYLTLGAAGLLALSVGTCTVQSKRLDHAKADLTAARAALIDPVTRKTWQSEAVKARRDAQDARRDLGTCHASLTDATAALDRQSATVRALGAETARAKAVSDKARADARSVAESYRQAAAAIPSAKPGPDRCASAVKLVRETAR